MNKLIKQTQLLLNSPATLKQKLKMVDTVIRPGIAYSFYAVPYSMPNIIKLDKNITKLDKKIIGLQKTILGSLEAPQTSQQNYHMTNMV
jgi:hypothetical protein